MTRQWTKHIDINVHFVHDRVLSGKFNNVYVPTKENPTDLYTKPLIRPTFTFLIPKLNLIDIHKPNHKMSTKWH